MQRKKHTPRNRKEVLLKTISIILLVCFANTTKAEPDVSVGKAKAVSCAACHGAFGISTNSLWPHLAGQNEAYLAKQMKDFRSGERKDPVMSAMAKPLSDEDIANLAAYFSGLK